MFDFIKTISSHTTIIAAVLSSSIVASLLTTYINHRLSRRREEELSKAKALEIAVKLEGFAIKCSDAAFDAELNRDITGSLVSYSKIPLAPEVSITSNLVSGKKKTTLINSIVCFPQFVAQANQHIDFYVDVVGDREAAAHASIKKARELGLKAIGLSTQLRSIYNLPKRGLIFGDYDVHKSLMGISNTSDSSKVEGQR